MNQQEQQTLFVQDITSVHRWIRCLAVVSFDIDEGQKVDLIIPVEQLSAEAERQLAMLAFPDSNALGDNEGTFKYIFRNTEGCFGFTCFKQKKDPKNPRGYSQKSLVVLTQLPFLVFFLKIAEFMVFKSFNDQSDVQQNLIALCRQIAKWPDPQPLKTYILPVLDYEITIQIPNYALRYENSPIPYKNVSPYENNKQNRNGELVSLQEILTKQTMLRSGLFQEVKLTEQYGQCMEALWTVWYMTLTNQSFLMMCNNPFTVSQAVLGAISIVSPLIYVGKFNPYVTVYDPQLNSLQVETKNHISGATNPLFSKLFTKIEIINLNSTFKTKKTIIPVKQLCRKFTNQQQRAINQAAIRKHFYRLNQSVIGILDSYLCMQRNDLKFFNTKDFMKCLKNRKEFQGLEDVFDGKKYLLLFFEEFLESGNFALFLKKRNVMVSG